MRISKQFAVVLLATVLLSSAVFAQVETEGVVVKVDKVENQLVVRTERGEETLFIDSNTKGLSNLKEGVKVTVKFTEKSGQPKVTEIIPR